MNLTYKIITLFVAIILLNTVSGGFIFLEAGETVGLHKNELGTIVKCGIGLALVSPLNEYTIFGREIVVFTPSFKDILITFVLTMAILYILSMRYDEISWPAMFALFIGIWFALKIAGLILVLSSGKECVELVNNANQLMSPLAQISMVAIPVMVAKVIARKAGFG
jgi:hypothetical protein